MSDEKVQYELTIDQPNLPKGELVQIPGLGTFENGHTYEVTKQEADSYRVYHTRQVPKEDKDGNIVGSDVELGPTLLQAMKHSRTVHVVTHKEGDDEPETPAGPPTPEVPPSDQEDEDQQVNDEPQGGDN